MHCQDANCRILMWQVAVSSLKGFLSSIAGYSSEEDRLDT